LGSEIGVVVVALGSLEVAEWPEFVLYHVQGHLLLENPVLKLFLLFIPSTFVDEVLKASCYLT